LGDGVQWAWAYVDGVYGEWWKKVVKQTEVAVWLLEFGKRK